MFSRTVRYCRVAAGESDGGEKSLTLKNVVDKIILTMLIFIQVPIKEWIN
jgi:hypothetical protein